MRISLSYSVFWYVHRNSLSHNDFSFKTRRTTASWIQDSHVPCMQRMRIIIFVQNSYSYSNLLSVLKLSIYSWNHESTFGFHFFFFFSFFFLHVAISDSVRWLPYLGFVPGPTLTSRVKITECNLTSVSTRTTSKGLTSLLFYQYLPAFQHDPNTFQSEELPERNNVLELTALVCLQRR